MSGDPGPERVGLGLPVSEEPLGDLDLLGEALSDYHGGDRDATLEVVSDAGDGETVEPLPVALFFRGPAELDAVDRVAMTLCVGRILDVGAGVGAVSLPLQDAGFRVTALEALGRAGRILRERGVRDVRVGDVRRMEQPSEGGWDTVLSLMNGTMPARTKSGLAPFLSALRALAEPAGRLLIDSTDPAALGADTSDGLLEVTYRFRYRGRTGPAFPQLFVSPAALETAGASVGWATESIWGPMADGRYLACLGADVVP